MRKIAATAVCLLLSIAASGARAADAPVLLKAIVSTHTNDNDKDHDTCVFVEIKNAAGDSLIAHGENHECSSDDSKQYKDGSDHQFELSADAVGMARPDAGGFKVHMWQETHGGRGHDTWKFNATVTLQFSDRTNLVAQVSDVTFESSSTEDRPAVDFENVR
jgi:hypothetical protein